MRDYYEELWERIPDAWQAPELTRRREFLRSELRPGARALDLGCGLGTFTAILDELGARATGVEVAGSALRRAQGLHPELDFRLSTTVRSSSCGRAR
jgi:2-polyprenyl-3-methyl-5-hydroxy-6-metoxy-1,4-benzoquinol methylase